MLKSNHAPQNQRTE